MFAFALWDRNRRRLLLARDHLGQKPLFWAQQGSRFWFASEIKGILAVAPEFRQVDPQALDEYFSIRVIADPRSMFKGINKLPPGHLLEFAEGRVQTRRYWDLRFEPKRQIKESDALEELDSRMRETVAFHLVSDVPVGAFLSGGVDSGLVVAMVRQVSRAPLDTFSVGFDYGTFDETPAARQVAERYGTRHHEERLDGSLLGLLPRLVHYLDEPSDPLSAGLYRLAALARQHVKVAVGGDGGDELFGGYDRYYGVQLVRYYAALPGSLRTRVARKVLDFAPDGFWYKSFANKVRWLDQLAEVEGGRRYARSLSYFYFTPERRATLYTRTFQDEVRLFDPEASLLRWYDDAGLKQDLDRMLLADSMVRLPNHPVMILDRMTMAHGLEARSPFLDHELAAFCAMLPVRLKVRGRRRRYLQMRLAERYLPREILHRPKQGLASALPYVARNQFQAAFRRLLEDPHLVRAGLLEPAAIHTLLTEHLSGRVDHGNRLWLLLNAELWYRLHIEESSVESLEEEMRFVTDAGTSGPGRTDATMPATVAG